MRLNTNAWNRLRYDLYAPLYDAVVARPFARARARSIGGLALRGDEHVLVAGCGTGLDFPYLPPAVRLTAGDISPAMTRRAAARAAALGIARADVRVLDAHRLDLSDASVDVVVLHLVVAVVPDPVAALREVARVVRPGGRITILDKFLPEGARPSPLRRAVGAVASVVATEVDRTLGPLLDAAGLVLESREAAIGGGLFEIARVRRSG